MSRYIDADAIKDKAWKAESEACFYALEDVVSVTDIDEAPSIDIEPKRGEWISVCGNKQCNCSVCGEGFDHTYEWIERWNFCPNCGARMKGADDE